MMVAFKLSMPQNNAWNGRWTGEGKLFARVRTYPKDAAEKILARGPYRYDFGDGWIAGISVEQVDSKEAAKIRRKSEGFYGYDWMIHSIERHGEIRVPERAS